MMFKGIYMFITHVYANVFCNNLSVMLQYIKVNVFCYNLSNALCYNLFT